jgi:hypothetical protein
MEKNFRIHTNIISDTFLNVNMQQDFDFLEILSLKLRQKDAYRLHSSNYGVVVGRVLANDAFGIPNAKVSVFIERDTNDDSTLRNIYPYSETMSKDSSGRRYNLLPDYSDDDCYRVVGTFPRKRYLLDDDVQLEVYEKYWKYTTVTNHAGDYMLFGVPSGGHQIHVDIDLSDIGILSQKPHDFIFKGHNIEEFDSASQFKESANLDSLVQIISQNKATNVYPFWGDAENGIAAITRCDIQVNYKFEPTCVFMGAIVSDNEGNSIGHKCAPEEDNGMNSQLVAGEGTIEMIRKTKDGLVEEFPIKGNALIDGDGVWCYQIPMNLDYVGTDEYGNVVPTDNPQKGLPTRTQVRFRFSKRETGKEGVSTHTAKYLVPMNPILDETSVVPKTEVSTGVEMEKMYNFGSNTPQSCFRDLYWNNVYSVKNYIPKVQVAHRAYAPNYGALKGSNLVDNQNSIPFNKLRIDLPFVYMIVCIIYTMIVWIVTIINAIICIVNIVLGFFAALKSICLPWPLSICPFEWFLGWIPDYIGCIPLSAGVSEGNIAYYPGCWCGDYGGCPEDMEGKCEPSKDSDELMDKIQRNLALDFKIIKLDFYQDWLNGTLYMPLWYWRKRKKKTFLFGLFSSSAKNEFCSCNKTYSRLKTYVTCSMSYSNNSLRFEDTDGDEDEERWHKKRRSSVRYNNGLIKPVENKDGLTAYYYVAYQPTTDDPISAPIEQRKERFQIAVLYATDIILLGNLNEDNLYGIPQFFKALPSTTANVPPIATIAESTSDSDSDDMANDDSINNASDVGTTITTGMDWNNDGDEDTPAYQKGLFIDLGCTWAATRPKSCVNVERISEFGMNPDMTYSVAYSNGVNDVSYGVMSNDGFITKLELDDMDNRATFATLNHIGFIPQDYQDSINSYTTQVQDETTGYLVPKFKYIYPVDLDGRSNRIMERYKGSFGQAMYDEADEAYISFRLGAEKLDKDKNLEGRIRHFYHSGSNYYEMPLYNNSFYFYFGVNNGKTAIDKFNSLFYAPCFQNSKAPFSFNLDYAGKAYCDDPYKKSNPTEASEASKAYNGHAYIRFTSEDIITPFSYKLYDESDNIVIEEDDMYDTDFVIGGVITSDGIEMNDIIGKVKYHTEPFASTNNRYGENGLTNQKYTLEIIDANGKKITERVELKVSKISANCRTVGLGAKFYDDTTTRIDYICNDENEFYGMLKISSFNVDGSLYYITAATGYDYDRDGDEDEYNGNTGEYLVVVSGENVKITATDSEVVRRADAVIRVSSTSVDSEGKKLTQDCMCDSDNKSSSGQTITIADGGEGPVTYVFTGRSDIAALTNPLGDYREYANQKEVSFFVYQPSSFVVSITQLCTEDGHQKEVEDNTSSEIVSISNGNNFNLYLNTMPVKFMIGTLSDSPDATIGNNSLFYRSSLVTNPKGDGLSGWYGVHQEDSYRWDLVLKANERIWGDFVKINGSITNHNTKGEILEYKFNKMFSLAKGAYITGSSSRYSLSITGSQGLTLWRAVLPDYTKATNGKINLYKLTEASQASCPAQYPMIVGKNYLGITGDGPQFNTVGYESQDGFATGFYFAAFTKNGGYTSDTKTSSYIKIMRAPSYAKVTPWNQAGEKRIGKDDKAYDPEWVERYKPAHTNYSSYLPYLRAMTVDRRIDFDLVLFTPTSNSINLYKKIDGVKIDERTGEEIPVKIDDGREYMWRCGRIKGTVYGGVEMSYDADYNIISAKTEVNISTETATATRNNRLEYSYEFNDMDRDAKTYYNIPTETIWEEDAYGTQKYVKDETEGSPTYGQMIPVVDDNGNPVYEDGKEPKPGQILKRFYEATFAGKDIRNYFWSTFNKERLTKEADNEKTNKIDSPDEKLDRYIYKYPSGCTMYNGDFNRDSVVVNNNYPTARYIDIGRIMPSYDYGLYIQSCCYGIKANYNEDKTITAETTGGDSIEFEMVQSSPISFAGNNTNADSIATFLLGDIMGCNGFYSRSGNTDGYALFKCNTISLSFKIKQPLTNRFKSYTPVPRLIKVLPYPVDGYDGISYVKTFAPSDSTDDVPCKTDNIYTGAIDRVKIFDFNDHMNVRNELSFIDLMFGHNCFIQVPDGIWYTWAPEINGRERTGNFFYKDGSGELITTDSNEFQAITYNIVGLGAKNGLDGLKMFTILVERIYKSTDEDGLEKDLHAFEFGDLYDIRDIYLKVTVDNDGDWNYIIKKTETTDEGETTVIKYIQTISFDLYFPPEEDPNDRACENIGVKNVLNKLVEYSVVFIDPNDDSKIYEATTSACAINPETNQCEYDVSGTSAVVVRVKADCPEEMKYLGSDEWMDNRRCYIKVRTSSGFTYKTATFKLYMINNQVLPEDEGGKKVTKAQIEGLQ